MEPAAPEDLVEMALGVEPVVLGLAVHLEAQWDKTSARHSCSRNTCARNQRPASP